MSKEESLIYKKKSNYKKRLFKRIKIFIVILIITITTFLISTYTKKIIKMYYKENSNINYLVYLKDNDYYEQPYLNKDMQYIASLIDYINVDFNYNFKINEQVKYDYYYYVEADVKVFEKNNESNIIFEKKSKLVDNKVYSDQEGLYFTIDQNLKINYGEYNELVRSFKNSYNVVADSNLTLTLYVYIEGEHKDFDNPIRTNNKMTLVIPLTEQMINVKMDYKDINNSDIIEQVSNKNNISNIFLGITIFNAALTLIALINVLKAIFKLIGKKTPYQKKIDSLLREYDRVIVEVKKSNLISKDNNFIEVKSFEELLDVSDRLELPILFYESKSNQRSIFIVKNNNEAYFYSLCAEDINEIENEKFISL